MRRKILPYALTALALVALASLGATADWQSGAELHTGFELASSILAAVVGLLALIRYHSQRGLTYLYLGIGFLGTALFDAFHTVTSSTHFLGLSEGPAAAVTAWGWSAGRMFLAVMVVASAWVRQRHPDDRISTEAEVGLFLIAGGLAVVVFALIATLDLPEVYTESGFITRPLDLIPGILFLTAFFWHWWLGDGRPDRFGPWLFVSLLVHAATQLLFIVFAHDSYSPQFDLAHLLKIIAYVITLFGLVGSMRSLLTAAVASGHELERLNEQLTKEVARRAEAEQSLSLQKNQIESIFARMSEGVMLIDTQRVIVRANPAAQHILGQPIEGMKIDTMFSGIRAYRTDGVTPIPPEEFATARALKGEEVPELRSWVVLQGRPDGLYLRASARPLLSPDGAVEGAVLVVRDVTAETIAQEEAAEHQARLRSVVETAHDAIVSIDEDSNILEFNPAAEALWGYSREEVMGQKVMTLMPPRFRDAHRDGVRRYLETRQARLIGETVELVALDRHGREVPVELSLAAWHTEEDTGFTAIIRDITDRKEAEARLRESEQTYRAMVTEVPEYAIYMLDPTGHIKTWNEGATRITGYAAEEVVGRSYTMFFPKEALDADLPAKILEDARGGRSESSGWRVRKDGSRYYARDVCTAITGPDGELRGFTKIEHDQTEDRRAEELLRESEERYRLLAENATDLVAVHSCDGVVHYASPAAANIIGYSPESLLGRRIQDRIHPEDRQAFERTLRRVSENEESTRATFRFLTAGNEVLWLESIIRWMPAGTPQEEDRLLATYRDVTEQVQDRNALARSNEELQEFAFIASHDLKEPLRKIIAFGERVESQSAGELGPRGMDYIARMRSAAERMRTLLDDLLAYSRVTTQAQPFSEVDLAALTGDVVDDLTTQIEETDAKVEIGDLPRIQADPTQMRQLLQNLISNALKYHRDDEAPRVAIEAKQRDSMIYLTVEDNGIGFDMRYTERIFRPFQRLHGRTEYSGSGMGLAIVRKIVERHGGDVRAESTPGQGSRFIISLPLNFTPSEPEPIRGSDPHA